MQDRDLRRRLVRLDALQEPLHVLAPSSTSGRSCRRYAPMTPMFSATYASLCARSGFRRNPPARATASRARARRSSGTRGGAAGDGWRAPCLLGAGPRTDPPPPGTASRGRYADAGVSAGAVGERFGIVFVGVERDLG